MTNKNCCGEGMKKKKKIISDGWKFLYSAINNAFPKESAHPHHETAPEKKKQVFPLTQ